MGKTTVIKNGLIVDGTGNPGFLADVLIEGDRVIEIGSNLQGDVVIDASGRIVAPGFIDIHTHYDAQAFWDPALTPSCFHGVTTVVAGNCGFSIAPTRPQDRALIANTMEKVEDMDPATLNAGIPWDFESFPEYLASIEQHGTLLNFAAYVGHTPLRIFVMGDQSVGRAATADEISRMADLVSEAMESGAAGFATSFAVTHRGADGQPIPSRWAAAEEIEALCKAVGDSGRGVIGVNGGENLSFADCYVLQPKVGAPITYTALLTTSQGTHLAAVEVHKEGLRQGVDVWPQVSCRPLSFSMTMVEPFTLNTSPIFAELMPKSIDARREAFASHEWRNRVRVGWENKQGLIPRWDSYEIMDAPSSPELVGRRLTDIANETGADPFDLLLELALLEPDLKLRVKAMLANDDAEGEHSRNQTCCGEVSSHILGNDRNDWNEGCFASRKEQGGQINRKRRLSQLEGCAGVAHVVYEPTPVVCAGRLVSQCLTLISPSRFVLCAPRLRTFVLSSTLIVSPPRFPA